MKNLKDSDICYICKAPLEYPYFEVNAYQYKSEEDPEADIEILTELCPECYYLTLYSSLKRIEENA